MLKNDGNTCFKLNVEKERRKEGDTSNLHHFVRTSHLATSLEVIEHSLQRYGQIRKMSTW